MKELDLITLTEDVENLQKGSIGTIVYDYGNNLIYEVEFQTDGEPVILTLNLSQFKIEGNLLVLSTRKSP